MSEFNEFDQQGSVPNRDTGSIISHAFEMYKGVFGYGIVAMIIYLIGGVVIQSVTGFNSANMLEEMKSSGGDFNYWNAPGSLCIWVLPAFSDFYWLLCM